MIEHEPTPPKYLFRVREMDTDRLLFSVTTDEPTDGLKEWGKPVGVIMGTHSEIWLLLPTAALMVFPLIDFDAMLALGGRTERGGR